MATHKLTAKLIEKLKKRDSSLNGNIYSKVINGYRNLEEGEKCILCCYLKKTVHPGWKNRIVNYYDLMEAGQNWYCENCLVALGYKW